MPMSPRLLRPRASASAGFDPRTISGLNLWIDFSDLSTLGPDATGPGTVTTEIGYAGDKSGSGNHGTQATGANRPALGTFDNGRACADWGTSTNSKRLIFPASGTQNRAWQDVCIVCKNTGTGNFVTNEGLFTGRVNATRSVGLIGVTGGQNWYTDGVSEWPESVSHNGCASTFSSVLTTLRSPCVVQFWRTATAVDVNGYSLGSDRNVDSRCWRGFICEVLSWNRNLTTDERSTVLAAMRAKWGTP